ncbi:MAG: NAD-dependent protein deacylase [Polyangiales bacterium]
MTEPALRELVERVRARLDGKRRLLFITGAGVSAESGLPTYRGVSGLYTNAHTEQGVPIEVALSGPMFRRKPELTWHHIAQIEQAVRGAQPNLAHRTIARLEQSHEVVVLTQNVDSLHRAAGSTQVIDIHGDCRELMCTRCDHRETRASYEGLTVPPHCPTCGAIVRPDVVLFEEALPVDKLQRLERELRVGFDAYFSIGTSSLFAYIAEPMLRGARRGALTVEINPEQTPISELVEIKLPCGAGEALSAVFDAPA